MWNYKLLYQHLTSSVKRANTYWLCLSSSSNEKWVLHVLFSLHIIEADVR